MLPGIYNELIFYYTFVDLHLDKAQHYYELTKKILFKDMDLNGRRVLAAYLYYVVNDSQAARAACDDGLRVADKFPIPAQAQMEIHLIKDLQERINVNLF